MELSEKAKLFKIGEYEHYKGARCRVFSVARHSETLEELVVYEHLGENGGVWARPLDMFLENVEVEGKTVPRFRFIG